MKTTLIGFSLLMLSTVAFGEITAVSDSNGQFSTYTLTLNGKDAKALNSVLKGKEHIGELASGIELLSCANADSCTIKIGADKIHDTRDLRNSDLFKAEADSIDLNSNPGTAISSPTAAYYLWKDSRKTHAENDKKLYALLKKSKSPSVLVSEVKEGTKLTLKTPNLNLSCIDLEEAQRFEYSIIDLGHMGGIGNASFKISHVCQLNAKIND